MRRCETTSDFDRRVRLLIYRHFVEEGRAPTMVETARALGRTTPEVREAFRRLAEGKALVLQPESGEVMMAEPFSAVPTSFVVEVGDRSWWGNCIWDALGIPAMLGEDARVTTACPDCNESMVLSVEGGSLVAPNGVVHFVVPAHRWWEDVVFT